MLIIADFLKVDFDFDLNQNLFNLNNINFPVNPSRAQLSTLTEQPIANGTTMVWDLSINFSLGLYLFSSSQSSASYLESQLTNTTDRKCFLSVHLSSGLRSFFKVSDENLILKNSNVLKFI